MGHSVGLAIAGVEGGVAAVEMGGDEATELEVVDNAEELGAVEGPEDGIEVVGEVAGLLALPEHAPTRSEAPTAEQSILPAEPHNFTPRFKRHPACRESRMAGFGVPPV